MAPLMAVMTAKAGFAITIAVEHGRDHAARTVHDHAHGLPGSREPAITRAGCSRSRFVGRGLDGGVIVIASGPRYHDHGPRAS